MSSALPTETAVLFTNVRIFDSSGSDPFEGEVLVRGNRDRRSAARSRRSAPRWGQGYRRTGQVPDVRPVRRSHPLLLGELCGPARPGHMGVEEHTLLCVRSAQTYIDCGYTMCVGAAAAKPRLDVVMRNAINAGQIPGPRYLANCQEIAVTGGALVKGITAFADGPEEMRKAVRKNVESAPTWSNCPCPGKRSPATSTPRTTTSPTRKPSPPPPKRIAAGCGSALTPAPENR